MRLLHQTSTETNLNLREKDMTSTSAEPAALEGSAPDAPAAAAGCASSLEPRGARLTRQTRRARLYTSAGVLVALLVVLVVLASENTHPAKLSLDFRTADRSTPRPAIG